MKILLATDGSQFSDESAWLLEHLPHTERLELTVLRELAPVVTTHVIESRHVGDGLVQFVKENKSDVIVLGSTGGGKLSTLLLGSVSKYVLKHAVCSVWMARKECVDSMPK